MREASACYSQVKVGGVRSCLRTLVSLAFSSLVVAAFSCCLRHGGHRRILGSHSCEHAHSLLLRVAVGHRVADPEVLANLITHDVRHSLRAIHTTNAQVDEEHVALANVARGHMLHTLHGRVGAAQRNDTRSASGEPPELVQLGGGSVGVDCLHDHLHVLQVEGWWYS